MRNIKNIPAFIFSLVYAVIAYSPASAQNQADTPETIDSDDQYELGTLIVYANKAAQPLYQVANQITLIDRSRLNQEQVQDLADIARYEPALEADYSGPRFGNTGLTIRNIGGNRVALELDSVPLPQGFAVGNFSDSGRTNIDPAIIKRIEVLRGPASVLYGSDAIGGVVIMETLDADEFVPADRQQAFQLRNSWYGSNDSSLVQATGAYAGEQGGILVSAGRRQGHELDNESRDTPDDSVDFTQHQGFAKWTHHFNEYASLRTSVDFFERDSQSNLRAVLGSGRFRNSSQLLGNDHAQRSRISIGYTYSPSSWFEQIQANVYRQAGDTRQSTFEERLSRGTPVGLQRDFFFRDQSLGGELKGVIRAETGQFQHLIVSGFEWDHTRLHESRDGTETNRITGISRRAILGEQFPLRDFPITRTDRIGVYVQDSINWGDWTFIPGLRWDHFDLDASTDPVLDNQNNATDLNNSELTLRLGASWSITRTFNAYAHYSEGFRAPPAPDVNLTLDIPQFNIRAVANPDLEPERSRSFELGFRWYQDGTSLQAAGYRSRFRNFIESRVPIGRDPIDDTLLFQSLNLARTGIYGAEFEASQDLGTWIDELNNWHFSAALHWARGENRVTNTPLNSVNPLSSVYTLAWQPNRQLQTELRVRYIARQDRVDFSDEEFFIPPSAVVADITGRWSPKPWMHWQFGFYNLFDERYWQFADTRNLAATDPRVEILSRPGRHANLGLRLDF